MGRNKQISDEALLEAARSVFVEQGFGASTREIAHRAGISEAVLYQRHKTKLDLFFAAMIPPPLELGADRDVGRNRGAIDELCALAIDVMNYFRQAMPVLLQLVSHPSFDVAQLADGTDRMPVRRLAEAFSDCLSRHRAKGGIAADAAGIQTATLTLVATLHSLALFERMGVHGGSFPDSSVRNIVKLVVAGLAREKGSKS